MVFLLTPIRSVGVLAGYEALVPPHELLGGFRAREAEVLGGYGVGELPGEVADGEFALEGGRVGAAWLRLLNSCLLLTQNSALEYIDRKAILGRLSRWRMSKQALSCRSVFESLHCGRV